MHFVRRGRAILKREDEYDKHHATEEKRTPDRRPMYWVLAKINIINGKGLKDSMCFLRPKRQGYG